VVAHHLAKVRVAGSNPVIRSRLDNLRIGAIERTPGPLVEWPSGEATACKAVHTGSIPVSTSFYLWRVLDPQEQPARLAQRESASLTRKRSLVQSQYRAPREEPRSSVPGFFSYGVQLGFTHDEGFLGVHMRMWRSGSASPCQGEGRGFESRHPLVEQIRSRAISSAGERFPDTEEVTGSIPVSRTTNTEPGILREPGFFWCFRSLLVDPVDDTTHPVRPYRPLQRSHRAIVVIRVIDVHSGGTVPDRKELTG
jgi:hypothetical protein